MWMRELWAQSKRRTSRKPKTFCARPRRPRLEPLEDRRLLVATISVTVDAPAAVTEIPQNQIVYSLNRDETDGFLSVNFELSGDAVLGVDYTAREVPRDSIRFPKNPPIDQPVTGVVTFFPGESTVELVVRPIADSILERDEAIVLTAVAADVFGTTTGAASLIVSGQDTQYYLIDDQNQLAIVDIEIGSVETLGTIVADQFIRDIAFTEDGSLYAISADKLYVVHPDAIGDGLIPVTSLGFHGILNANSLIDARNGDFGSETGDLFAVGQSFLGIQWIDLETTDETLFLNNVTTVFDIGSALQSLSVPSDYIASGDLDYVAAGHLVLSASRSTDDFDSLIEIQTPGTVGVVQKLPKPSEDLGETFSQILGLAFQGSDSFGFSGHTMLRVNQFSRNSSRELEMTGRPYEIALTSFATGIIIGNPVPAPVVTIASLGVDPTDLPEGQQPTSWSNQRSDLRDIVIDLGAPIDVIPEGSIVMSNLGMTLGSAPVVVDLRSDQITLDPSGDRITILLDAGQLPDGRYELNFSPQVTTGSEFTFAGDASNRFFVLTGDWDGSGGVDILDVETFAYWVGGTIPNAPEYVDPNGSGTVTAEDFVALENNHAIFVQLPDAPSPIDPRHIDETALQYALQTALNRLNVNGQNQVTPLDALNVINRLSSGFPTATDWRYDVNRDGIITPRDALRVINALALQSNSNRAELFTAPVADSDRSARSVNDERLIWALGGFL